MQIPIPAIPACSCKPRYCAQTSLSHKSEGSEVSAYRSRRTPRCRVSSLSLSSCLCCPQQCHPRGKSVLHSRRKPPTSFSRARQTWGSSLVLQEAQMRSSSDPGSQQSGLQLQLYLVAELLEGRFGAVFVLRTCVSF